MEQCYGAAKLDDSLGIVGLGNHVDGYAKRLKPMWILGGSILVIVSLKLVLFDLSHTGTLTRVISFLLAGGVMLLIAYIAPMPDGEKRV